MNLNLFAQINIYVSNSGTNYDNSLVTPPPAINSPFKTLEDVLNYINDYLVNSNNEVTSPVNIILMNNGGNIMVSNVTNDLIWDVSGTIDNPITITSLNCRTILTRNSDSGHMITFINVNHLSIQGVEFDKVTRGAIKLDDCDNNNISYCAFHGGSTSVVPFSSGIIWIGVQIDYDGEGTRSSSENVISNNYFYNMNTTLDTNQHHAIYFSNGAHNNSIYNNDIKFPPSYGVHGEHGDYNNNSVSTNLVSRKHNDLYSTVTGITLQHQQDSGYNNGSPSSIYDNNVVNNYIYDSENNGDGVTFASPLDDSNNKNNNHQFDYLVPNDPYWLGYDANMITDNMVSGDFDNDGVEDEIAAFYDYNGETRIHVWSSVGKDIDYIEEVINNYNTNADLNLVGHDDAFEYSGSNGWWIGSSYTASRIKNRVVSGDFDSDGKKNDIAVFYDYGGQETKIHIWISNGAGFDAPQTVWATTGYDATKISGRIVSGDFDGDGNKNEIAVFYDYGNNETRIHVWRIDSNWLNQLTGATYSGSSGWWQSNSFQAGKISDRVVSGNFDKTTSKDEIAVFYDDGNNQTSIRVFKASGVSFVMNNWWMTAGYDANKITNRTVSGDFDRDGGDRDDIAAFYDYGNGETRIHVWESENGYFQYSGSNGGWITEGYSSENITGRVVSGDFDRDGKSNDISAFYDFSKGCGSLRSHVWKADKSSQFFYTNGSLGFPWMTRYSSFRSENEITLEEGKPENVRSKVNIYPNPSNDIVYFEASDFNCRLILINSQGKTVKDTFIENDIYSLNVQNLKSGIYFYRLIGSSKIETGKLVVSH
jgi:hypothetical protein